MNPLPASATPPHGELPAILSDSLAGYEIMRKIHRGGQGVVYEARQTATHRRVAVKVTQDSALADSHEKARFEREVRILGRSNTPTS